MFRAFRRKKPKILKFSGSGKFGKEWICFSWDSMWYGCLEGFYRTLITVYIQALNT